MQITFDIVIIYRAQLHFNPLQLGVAIIREKRLVKILKSQLATVITGQNRYPAAF